MSGDAVSISDLVTPASAANPSWVNCGNITPLMIACSLKHPQIVKDYNMLLVLSIRNLNISIPIIRKDRRLSKLPMMMITDFLLFEKSIYPPQFAQHASAI